MSERIKATLKDELMGLAERARLLLSAFLNPRLYFRCAACGSGPWHNSWAWIEDCRDFDGNMQHLMPTKPLGGCCSGAD